MVESMLRLENEGQLLRVNRIILHAGDGAKTARTNPVQRDRK